MLFLLHSATIQPADVWIGQLFDANCADTHQELQRYDDCVPGAQTAAFSLQVSGRMLKLDAGGNRKAVQAWKNYMQETRPIDPDIETKAVTAIVEGTVNGDEIKVGSIELR